MNEPRREDKNIYEALKMGHGKAFYKIMAEYIGVALLLDRRIFKKNISFNHFWYFGFSTRTLRFESNFRFKNG